MFASRAASIVAAGVLTSRVFLSTAAAGADPPGSVTIRSYDMFGVTQAEMRSARDVASALFADAGIQATWRECPTSARQRAADRCTDVLSPREVIVRLVTTPRSVRRDGPLGASYVDEGWHSGVLATVFADRIRGAASRTRADAAALFGRAIAHEVGHLLIGSAQHAPRGLMRAWWSDQELERNLAGDWLFSRDEAARMRQALVARARQPRP